MSPLAQSSPNLFLEWKWGNWQRQQQNCQQFSHFVNDYTSVSSHILCNCTYNWVTSVTPEDKGQPNTWAEEEKQALPLNMIKRSWFHGWIAVVIEGILITLQVMQASNGSKKTVNEKNLWNRNAQLSCTEIAQKTVGRKSILGEQNPQYSQEQHMNLWNSCLGSQELPSTFF